MAQSYYDPAAKPSAADQQMYGAPPQQQQSIYASQQQPAQGGFGAAPGVPLLQSPVPLGVGGLPQARPRFNLPAEDGIRFEHGCCDYKPGPNIPLHWFDGGSGWVTKYFYDFVLRDPKAYEPGKFRCQVPLPNGQLCNHEVSETDCCKGNCCWSSFSGAHLRMGEHVRTAHGQHPPPRRAWASELCDTEGCCDSYFCAPCQGSRQMMALAGWEDEFHWGWCLFFTFLGFRTQQAGGRSVVYWIPPWVYVAIMTRIRMVALNNIDEGVCTTLCTALCCSLCSMNQTYRELSASGVWPGSSCGSQRPANYASIGVSSPPVNKATMV
jgi:hypothetical protein